MIPRSVAVLALVALLVPAPVAGDAVIDTSTTREYKQTFENYLSGQTPCGGTRSEDSWCAHATTASFTGSSIVMGSATMQGANLWRFTDAAAAQAAQIQNVASGANLCSPAGQTFSFQFKLLAGIGSGQSFDLRLLKAGPVGTSQPAGSLGIVVSGATGSETVSAYVRGNTGTGATGTASMAYAAGTVVTVLISNINCAGPSAAATFTFSGAITTSLTLTDGGPITDTLNSFGIASTGTLSSGTSMDVDVYDWNGAPLPTPTVTSITPATGTTAGGTSVTIAGTNFRSGATVMIGGVAATGVNVASSTSITATTPAHAAGAVNVVVTNADGQAATLTNGYTYGTPCPVDPSSQDAQETFDGQTAGARPTACWYTFAADGTSTNGVVVSGAAPNTSPPKSQQLMGGTMTNTGAAYDFNGVNLCSYTTTRATPVVVDMRIDNAWTSASPGWGLAAQSVSAVGGGIHYGGGGGANPSAAIFVQFNGPTGNPLLSMMPGGSAFSYGVGFTPSIAFSVGTYYTITIQPSCFNSSTGTFGLSATATIKNLATGAIQTASLQCGVTLSQTTSPGSAIPCGTAPAQPMNLVAFAGVGAYMNSGTPPKTYIDNLLVKGKNAPDTVTVSVPGLIGMDVSPFGNFLADRTSVAYGGPNGFGTQNTIESRRGNDLAVASSVGSNCAVLDGVATFESGGPNGNKVVSWLQSGGGTGGTCPGEKQLFIHDYPTLLTNPSWPIECDNDGDPFCDPFIGFFGNDECGPADLNDQATSVTAILNYPFDYSRLDTEGNDHVLLPVAYATSTGRIGVYTEIQINNSNDACNRAEKSFGPDLPRICAAHVGAEAPGDYLLAAAYSEATAVYKVNIDVYEPDPFDTGSGLVKWQSRPTLSYQTDLGTASTSQSLGCARQYVIYDADGASVPAAFSGVTIKNWLTGEVLFHTSDHAKARGVAMSADGQFAAYVDTVNLIHVLDLGTHAPSSTTEKGTVVPPSSTNVVDMEFNNPGTVLYFGADQKITRFNLVGLTRQSDVACDAKTQCGAVDASDPTNPLGDNCTQGFACQTVANPTAGSCVDKGQPCKHGGGFDGDPTFPGLDVKALANASGMSETAFAGMTCVFLIIAFGAGFGVLRPILGLVAGVGAIALCLFFGLMPLWLAIFLAALMVAGFIFMQGRSG